MWRTSRNCGETGDGQASRQHYLSEVLYQPGHQSTTCLMTELRTGVIFDQEWLVKTLLTFRIRYGDELLRGVEGALGP